MKRPDVRLSTVIALLLLAHPFPAAAGGKAAPAKAGAAPKNSAAPAKSVAVQWLGWDQGLGKAATDNRPVLVDVYTDWCGWCRRMDHDVYARPDVRDYLSRRFVTVRLNAESSEALNYSEKQYTGSSLAASFGVTGYPTTIFLKPNGEHLVNVPGYVEADRFLLLLRYIGDGDYEKGVSFDDFVKANGGAASH